MENRINPSVEMRCNKCRIIFYVRQGIIKAPCPQCGEPCSAVPLKGEMVQNLNEAKDKS